MTDKEELIKAFETIRDYCLKHQNNCFYDCLLCHIGCDEIKISTSVFAANVIEELKNDG